MSVKARGVAEADSGLAALLAKVPTWLVRASAALGPVGVILALVVGAQALFRLRGPGWAVALAIGMAALLVVAIVMLYIEQYLKVDALERKDLQHTVELEALSRDAQMSAALPSFHGAMHLLRDACFLVRAGDSEASYFQLLHRSLAEMASVFHTVTGVPCRMCVKELVASADAPENVTLSSEDDEKWFLVKTRYRHDGSVGTVKDEPTPLQLNTDFRSVWHPRDRQYFFSNDLDAEPNYHNPHRKGDPENFDYNATIVWPIQKRKSTSDVDLIGYLCVDARIKGCFKSQNDFDIGAAYADSLYTALALCREAEASRGGAPSAGSAVAELEGTRGGLSE